MSLSMCVFIQMTALSVGYIQTYRDSVDSLGESVDMSIKVKLCVCVVFILVCVCVSFYHFIRF